MLCFGNGIRLGVIVSQGIWQELDPRGEENLSNLLKNMNCVLWASESPLKNYVCGSDILCWACLL